MANKDVFGYDTSKTSTGGVMNFQNVAIWIEGDSSTEQVLLTQNATVSYGRQVNPVMGAGTTAVYLIPSPPTGRLQVSRAIIGDPKGKGIFKPFIVGDACKESTITLQTLPNGCSDNTKDLVQAKGLLASVQLQLNVGGGLGLTDGAEWTLSSVTAQ